MRKLKILYLKEIFFGDVAIWLFADGMRFIKLSLIIILQSYHTNPNNRNLHVTPTHPISQNIKFQ